MRHTGRPIANAAEGRLRVADRVESEQEGRTLAPRCLTAALAFATVSCLSGPVLAVEYMLEFEGLWDGTHVEGGTLPGGAHFTTLIGATHDAGDPLWESGGMATQGIENVAELGSTAALALEIQVRIMAGTAGEEITTSSINSFPTTTQSTFEIEVNNPNVTLISMVAPSPDWFVGVSDVSLRNGGLWVEALTVDLHPYDAGTEEGSGFSLSNPATNPQEPITLINGSPFVGSPLIGRLHFTLLPPQVTPTPTVTPTLTPTPTSTPTPTPTPVAEMTSGFVDTGGGTVSTGMTATSSDPVETSVMVPSGTAGGEVVISEGPITEMPPSGFNFFGQQVDITAPDGTVASPLVFTFSLFAPGMEPNDVEIFKATFLVGPCVAAGANPDPCVESRTTQGADNILIVARTSTASPWNLPEPGLLLQLVSGLLGLVVLDKRRRRAKGNA